MRIVLLAYAAPISFLSFALENFLATQTAYAQTGCSEPGCYGPVQEEPGLHDKGGYMQVSHQATVNLFGGNLIVSSEDISLPSIGGFKLHFRRTHNSSRTFHPPPLVLDENNSPLGFGWTSHYGILFLPGASGSTAPEFVDNAVAENYFIHTTTSTTPFLNSFAWRAACSPILIERNCRVPPKPESPQA
jgi:hypothetical protein